MSPKCPVVRLLWDFSQTIQHLLQCRHKKSHFHHNLSDAKSQSKKSQRHFIPITDLIDVIDVHIVQIGAACTKTGWQRCSKLSRSSRTTLSFRGLYSKVFVLELKSMHSCTLHTTLKARGHSFGKEDTNIKTECFATCNYCVSSPIVNDSMNARTQNIKSFCCFCCWCAPRYSIPRSLFLSQSYHRQPPLTWPCPHRAQGMRQVSPLHLSSHP